METEATPQLRTPVPARWTVSARGLNRRTMARPADSPAPAGVMHLTAECWPYARTGGLGEAVSALAAHQAAAGIPTTVVLPLYRCVRDAFPALEPLGPAFTLAVGLRIERAHLFTLRQPYPGPRVIFVELPAFFDRDGLYGEGGADYEDNVLRFAFFCRAALQTLGQIAPEAEVLHAHDWHTALAPVYLRTALAEYPEYRRLTTVLSVHNAAFQGHCPPEMLPDLGLPPALYDWRLLESYGRASLLKGGLAFADAVVAVSPTHSRELCTPDGGFGLHEHFAALGNRLRGIVNGIDLTVWDPASDRHLPAHFTVSQLEGKRGCKAALQEELGLAVRPEVPLIVMCTRLTEQKGLDLVLGGALEWARDAQFAFLGEGEARYASALGRLAAEHPGRIAAVTAFQDALEHRLIGGADLVLMPSRYEPCGLTQMRAQRYGAIPVARRVRRTGRHDRGWIHRISLRRVHAGGAGAFAPPCAGPVRLAGGLASARAGGDDPRRGVGAFSVSVCGCLPARSGIAGRSRAPDHQTTAVCSRERLMNYQSKQETRAPPRCARRCASRALGRNGCPGAAGPD